MDSIVQLLLGAGFWKSILIFIFAVIFITVSASVINHLMTSIVILLRGHPNHNKKEEDETDD